MNSDFMVPPFPGIDLDCDGEGRPEPPSTAGELHTLVGYMQFLRATIVWKTSGLSSADLATRLPGHPSSMTLGGLLKHLAYVEFYWFEVVVGNSPVSEPWVSVDWSEDEDWDWNSAHLDSPEAIRQLWRAQVARSNNIVHQAVRRIHDSSETLEQTFARGEHRLSLRWILTHIIEEYGRHCGHADLLREAIDGATGE